MGSVAPIRLVPPAVSLKSACSACSLEMKCLPAGLSVPELAQFEQLTRSSRSVKRGTYLYRAGSPHKYLYVVRAGSCKSIALQEDGLEQVIGFHLRGEVIGFDGIYDGTHLCNAVALEDSVVCEIPFAELEMFGRQMPTLQNHVHRLMGKQIAQDHHVMLVLGSMRAEERLAVFLLNLAERYASLGYSKSRFTLSMTREDIGSFLGMKLETVSRAFSAFKDQALIDVKAKDVELRNPDGLQAMMREHL